MEKVKFLFMCLLGFGLFVCLFFKVDYPPYVDLSMEIKEKQQTNKQEQKQNKTKTNKKQKTNKKILDANQKQNKKKKPMR